MILQIGVAGALAAADLFDLTAQVVSRGRVPFVTAAGAIKAGIGQLVRRPTTERLNRRSRAEARAANRRARLLGFPRALRVSDPFTAGFSLVQPSQLNLPGLVPTLQFEAAVRKQKAIELSKAGFRPLTLTQRERMLSAGEFPSATRPLSPAELANFARLQTAELAKQGIEG